MGKKRKAPSGPSGPKGPKEFDSKDARLGPINSFADIADDQEKYFLNQDQILFDDVPQSKRQRRQDEEDDFLENSDEEVFDDDDDEDSEEDDDDDEPRTRQPPPKSKKRNAAESDSEGEEAAGAGEEGDSGWWGSSKGEYYDNDQLETEADALEEEKEALRLQKKRLANMSEEAFIFDENEWLAPETEEAGDDQEVVTEVLKDIEIPPDMSNEERYRLLQRLYPEIDPLAEQLAELQPLLIQLQGEAEGQESRSLAVVRYRILGCYVATLAMYFATLTSPARDATGTSKTLSPTELRDHEVMGTLLECREAWKRVEHLKPSGKSEADGMLTPPDEEMEDAIEDLEATPKASKKDAAKRKAEKKAARKAQAIEDSIADLDGLLTSKSKKSKQKTARDASPQDDNSDFGEEESLDARAAADKAARKKSLRFYTSQIVQKARKRADAGRDAGGDEDIPYRERLRDRQARLNAQAEKRGQKGGRDGAAPGDSSDEEDDRVAGQMRGDEEDYYDMVAQNSKGRKDQKAAAKAAANTKERIYDDEEVGEDGRRQINRAIEKNKGLTPKRKKDVRNPRVKKKRKYEEKQKKIRSQKATYKGGEGRGGYQGELTGIKPGLVKSVKL